MERGPVQLNIPRDHFYGDVQVCPLLNQSSLCHIGHIGPLLNQSGLGHIGHIGSLLNQTSLGHVEIAGENSCSDGDGKKRRRPRVDC